MSERDLRNTAWCDGCSKRVSIDTGATGVNWCVECGSEFLTDVECGTPKLDKTPGQLGLEVVRLEEKVSLLQSRLFIAVEALKDIKYHADNPFNSKDGSENSRWLNYCQEVAGDALTSITQPKETK